MTSAAMARPAGGGTVGRIIGFVGRQRELTLVLIMLLLGAAVTGFKPNFLTSANLNQVTAFAAIIAIAAVGEGLVVITKNVDLSVESTIGLVAFVVADILSQQQLSVPAAWAIGLALGLVLGMVNGVVVTVFKVPSIVAGLGTLSIYRGFTYFVANGHEINLAQLPPRYSAPANQTFLGIPLFVILAVVVVIVVGAWLRLTRFGRSIYAVGSNAEAAGILGVNSGLVTFVVFALCGLLAGLAGILWGINFGTITASSASGVVLQVIAAVVVGGVTIAGGSGTVAGAALGALFLAVINNGLLVLGLPQEPLLAIYGTVILVAVGADAVIRGRARREAARSRAR
jgi:rhamnose transport system permease protein